MELTTAIQNELFQSIDVLKRFIDHAENIEAIATAARLMADCLATGGKIISCGNGGSYCDAMHFAEELTGRYRLNRKPLAAIAISDASYITCVGNDFGYDKIFSHYVEAIAKPGDVLLAISTSGQSTNIIEAVNYATLNKIKTVVLNGKDGGQLAGKATIEITVPHSGFADRIQEVHIKIIHTLVLSIENLLFDRNEKTSLRTNI